MCPLYASFLRAFKRFFPAGENVRGGFKLIYDILTPRNNRRTLFEKRGRCPLWETSSCKAIESEKEKGDCSFISPLDWVSLFTHTASA